MSVKQEAHTVHGWEDVTKEGGFLYYIGRDGFVWRKSTKIKIRINRQGCA